MGFYYCHLLTVHTYTHRQTNDTQATTKPKIISTNTIENMASKSYYHTIERIYFNLSIYFCFSYHSIAMPVFCVLMFSLFSNWQSSMPSVVSKSSHNVYKEPIACFLFLCLVLPEWMVYVFGESVIAWKLFMHDFCNAMVWGRWWKQVNSFLIKIVFMNERVFEKKKKYLHDHMIVIWWWIWRLVGDQQTEQRFHLTHGFKYFPIKNRMAGDWKKKS